MNKKLLATALVLSAAVVAPTISDAAPTQGAQNKANIKINQVAIAALDEKVDHEGALSAALAGLQAQAFDSVNKTQVLGGVGYYGGQTGVAFGVAHKFNDRASVQSGFAFDNNDKMMANIGFSLKVGKSSEGALVSGAEYERLMAENAAIREENAQMKAQIAMLMKHVGLAY